MPFINAFHTPFCTHHLNSEHWICRVQAAAPVLAAKKKKEEGKVVVIVGWAGT